MLYPRKRWLTQNQRKKKKFIPTQRDEKRCNELEATDRVKPGWFQLNVRPPATTKRYPSSRRTMSIVSQTQSFVILYKHHLWKRCRHWAEDLSSKARFFIQGYKETDLDKKLTFCSSYSVHLTAMVVTQVVDGSPTDLEYHVESTYLGYPAMNRHFLKASTEILSSISLTTIAMGFRIVFSRASSQTFSKLQLFWELI